MVVVIMFSIGEFASIGRVSVRMLRHYDEIGLLPPARVDPFSGTAPTTVGSLPCLGASWRSRTWDSAFMR